jgi:hypothetical protein
MEAVMTTVWRSVGWNDPERGFIRKPGINPDRVTFTELTTWGDECRAAFPEFEDFRLVMEPQHDWTGRGADEWYVEGLITVKDTPF